MVAHLEVGTFWGRPGLLLCQMIRLTQGWGGRMGPCVAPDNPSPYRKEGADKRGLRDWKKGTISVVKDSPGPESVEPWISPCLSLGLEVPFTQGEISGSWLPPPLTWLLSVPPGTLSESRVEVP